MTIFPNFTFFVAEIYFCQTSSLVTGNLYRLGDHPFSRTYTKFPRKKLFYLSIRTVRITCLYHESGNSKFSGKFWVHTKWMIPTNVKITMKWNQGTVPYLFHKYNFYFHYLFTLPESYLLIMGLLISYMSNYFTV